MSISDVQNTSQKDIIKTFILAPQWTSNFCDKDVEKTAFGHNFAVSPYPTTAFGHNFAVSPYPTHKPVNITKFKGKHPVTFMTFLVTSLCLMFNFHICFSIV